MMYQKLIISPYLYMLVRILKKFPDINECETNTDLCGGGDNTCNNIDDGGFYECVCADGFESNELAASGLLLTCVGMYVHVCMGIHALLLYNSYILCSMYMYVSHYVLLHMYA